MAKKNADLPVRRYGTIYLFDARMGWNKRNVATHGATERLKDAIGNASRHVERSLLDDTEYPKAVVYDRWEQRILFVYSRTADGMTRKDYRKEHRPFVRD